MISVNGHEFLEIPEGMSCLGSGLHDPYAGERDRPLREVFISTFQIARYPTTNRQLSEFLSEVPWDYPLLANEERWQQVLESTPEFPAISVSWELANHGYTFV